MFVITIEEIKEHVKKEIEKDLFSDEAVKSSKKQGVKSIFI